MLHSIRLQAVALAFRAMGIFLAVGCAVVFDGQMPASAQGTEPGSDIAALLSDPAWCWWEEYYAGKDKWELTGADDEPFHPSSDDIARYRDGIWIHDGENLIITDKRGRGLHRMVRVPCPTPETT